MPEYQLSHLKETEADIPTLTVAIKDLPLTAPRAIVLHGLFGHKEKYLEELYLLAQKGIRATAIDMALHGERENAGTGAVLLQSEFAATLRRVIYETATDVSSLLDSWGGIASAVGLYGVSAGGFVSHAVCLRDQRIKVLVALISSPDWTTANASYAPAQGSQAWIELAAMSPVNYPDAYLPRPVLLLNGTEDDVVTSDGSELLYSRLAPLYDELSISHRLHLELYPGVAHVVLPEMRSRGIEWLNLHLSSESDKS